MLDNMLQTLRGAQVPGQWTTIKEYRNASKALAKTKNTNLQPRVAGKIKPSAKERSDYIAVFDTETTPFDNTKTEVQITPFLGVIYTEQNPPIIIWENDHEKFQLKVSEAFEALEPKYTVYAHNGGKFDYKFMLAKQRGRIRCKGGSIMEFDFKGHTFRDSLHILPVALAKYHKQKFDYTKLRAEVREQHRAEIIEYCVSDCKNAHEIIKEFITRNGFKMSIGQAALSILKKDYEFERLTDVSDAYARRFYFGGRTECFKKVGEYNGRFNLYDVNSMYPFVMSAYRHPIGNISHIGAEITDDTVFIRLTCTNRGALAARGEDGRVDCTRRKGEFHTTIHEYNTALKYGLISDVQIISTVDFEAQTDFSKFVDPLYARRQIVKEALAKFPDDLALMREDLILKLLLNNAYGKFAQNWRNFRETFITDPDEYPSGPGAEETVNQWGDVILWGVARNGEQVPNYKGDNYWVWRRKNADGRFYNVATAASITGAARAVLMGAIQHADTPLYCDTDSLICKSLDSSILVDRSQLGAWKHERSIKTVRLGGKKLYGYTYELSEKELAKEDLNALLKVNGKHLKTLTKCKGAALTWTELHHIIQGAVVETIARGPTIGMDGSQCYIRKDIKATGRFGPSKNYPLLGKRIELSL